MRDRKFEAWIDCAPDADRLQAYLQKKFPVAEDAVMVLVVCLAGFMAEPECEEWFTATWPGIKNAAMDVFRPKPKLL